MNHLSIIIQPLFFYWDERFFLFSSTTNTKHTTILLSSLFFPGRTVFFNLFTGTNGFFGIQGDSNQHYRKSPESYNLPSFFFFGILNSIGSSAFLSWSLVITFTLLDTLYIIWESVFATRRHYVDQVLSGETPFWAKYLGTEY